MELSLYSSLSTHPQSLHCGEICVWGTGCDSVGGNRALKREEKSPEVSSVSDCNQHASTTQHNPQLTYSLYLRDKSAI